MGKTRWDLISGTDSEISHSTPRLGNTKQKVILHRDLKISAPYDPHMLAASLADETLFRFVVPTFLRNWNGSSDRWLLDGIALAIENGAFAGKSAIRFGVAPIPDWTAKPPPDYFFEIRMIVDLDDIIIPPQTAAKVAEYLGQTKGVLNAKFKRGLGALIRGIKNPKNRKFRGAYPEFDKLFKKIFSPTPKTPKKRNTSTKRKK
jgi:hypothetical protein